MKLSRILTAIADSSIEEERLEPDFKGGYKMILLFLVTMDNGELDNDRLFLGI